MFDPLFNGSWGPSADYCSSRPIIRQSALAALLVVVFLMPWRQPLSVSCYCYLPAGHRNTGRTGCLSGLSFFMRCPFASIRRQHLRWTSCTRNCSKGLLAITIRRLSCFAVVPFVRSSGQRQLVEILKSRSLSL